MIIWRKTSRTKCFLSQRKVLSFTFRKPVLTLATNLQYWTCPRISCKMCQDRKVSADLCLTWIANHVHLKHMCFSSYWEELSFTFQSCPPKFRYHLKYRICPAIASTQNFPKFLLAFTSTGQPNICSTNSRTRCFPSKGRYCHSQSGHLESSSITEYIWGFFQDKKCQDINGLLAFTSPGQPILCTRNIVARWFISYVKPL